MNSLASLPVRSGPQGGHIYAHAPVYGSAHPNLPSRYRVGLRDATRPTVIQPSRPSASPRALRRGGALPPHPYGSGPSTSGLPPHARNASLSMVSAFLFFLRFHLLFCRNLCASFENDSLIFISYWFMFLTVPNGNSLLNTFPSFPGN